MSYCHRSDGACTGQSCWVCQPETIPTYGLCLSCRSIEVSLVEVVGSRNFSNIGESAEYPVGHGCEVCA